MPRAASVYLLLASPGEGGWPRRPQQVRPSTPAWYSVWTWWTLPTASATGPPQLLSAP